MARDFDGSPGKPYVLILGTADWNQPIATNQHYVVQELCRDGFAEVTFMESMGLRRPQLNKRDISRIARRVRGLASEDLPLDGARWRAQPLGLDVRSLLNIPVHSGFLSLANGPLLNSKVKDWISYAGPKVLWTYTPATYGLEKHADAVFYHCVDLLGTVQGISTRVIDHGERHLARFGASAISTSRVVQDHLQGQGFVDVGLWENVADVEKIKAANPLNSVRMPGRVIFAGNLSPNKVDYRILEALADVGLDVCVAGPRAEGGGDDSPDFKSMLAHGVKYLGMLSLEQLAEELSQASIGVIPYVLNDYTRGVSPLKTFEYLAAGLPVISTDIPGTPRGIEGIWVEPHVESFVSRALSLCSPPRRATIEARMEVADAHSWAMRGQQVRETVKSALETDKRSR